MAILKSAKKAIRAAARRQIFNMRRKEAVLGAKKKLQKLVKAGKISEAKKLLSTVYKATDKAAKVGFLKKNAAARIKSRLTALVNKASKK